MNVKKNYLSLNLVFVSVEELTYLSVKNAQKEEERDGIEKTLI